MSMLSELTASKYLGIGRATLLALIIWWSSCGGNGPWNVWGKLLSDTFDTIYSPGISLYIQ